MATGDSDPGAPGAIGRTLRLIEDRIGTAGIDRLWIYPPLKRGRKEWGLLVVAGFLDAADADEVDTRRDLHTARYVAEVTGQGMEYEMELTTEGTLPRDRFTRVLTGVARRADEGLGEPRTVEIDGTPERFEALLVEYEVASDDESEARGPADGTGADRSPARPEPSEAASPLEEILPS